MSRRRQRSSTTPLEDAKAAIENKNNLSEDDRYTLLSDNLSELDEEQRLSLVELCIEGYWVEGLSSVIADISLKSLDSNFPLIRIVKSSLTEKQKVRLMAPILLKGGDVNFMYLYMGRPARSGFCAFVTLGTEEADSILPATTTPLLLPPVTTHKDVVVSFSQCVVSRNLSSVLKALLPKLDINNMKPAFIEAFGGNKVACCEVIVDFLKSRQGTYRSFAILLCCVFDRVEFLEMLLDGASEETLEPVRRDSAVDREFCALPLGIKRATTLEATVYFNYSDCAKMLLRHGILTKTEKILVKLLEHCAKKGVIEMAKELLEHHSATTSTESLNKILLFYLEAGNDLETVTRTIELMKSKEDGSKYLETVMSRCASHRLWHGLHILAFGGKNLLGHSQEIKDDAAKTLLDLVNQNLKRPEIINDINKNLLLLVIDHGITLQQVMVSAVRSENIEMVKFILSLDKKEVFEEFIKTVLERETIYNDDLRTLLEKFLISDDVKQEAQEE